MIETALRTIITTQFPSFPVYVATMPQTVNMPAISIRDISDLRDGMYKKYNPIIQFTIVSNRYSESKNLGQMIMDFLVEYKGVQDYVIDGVEVVSNVNFKKETLEYRVIDAQVNYRLLNI